MKIFSASQIREWDAYTIANEPVSSLQLMERAATACYHWVKEKFTNNRFKIFCGKGNNGGDGLVIARKLLQEGKEVIVYILEFGHKGTNDFQVNLQRLHELTKEIHFIQSAAFFPVINSEDVVIDAILGTGLNKPVEGFTAELVEYINRSKAIVISIDIPTGMFADKSCKSAVTIKANYTLSFQQSKLCFLLPENESISGEVFVLDIGLHPAYYQKEEAVYEWIDNKMVQQIYKPRKKFSHKGTYGHAALITGSEGMMGAATLCAQACLRSGTGKLTCYIPACGNTIMQLAVPEAMSKISGSSKHIEEYKPVVQHKVIGLGPGIGLYPTHAALLQVIFSSTQQPIVIDADALNTLASKPELLNNIPSYSILTPHPAEFERLFGKANSDFNRLQMATDKAKQFNCYIILKGHNSFIACPDGKGYFNSTGNAGMATGGTGDVLTGILTGLLACGYTPFETCIMGIYLHGLAGDLAAEKFSQEAMLAGDIINELGSAFQQINKGTTK